MESYDEAADQSEVFKARQMVFLAEVQEALRSQEGLFGISLRMDVTRDRLNVTRRVVAFEHGEEITTQDGDGRGSHGVYVHPLHGRPIDIAFGIAVDRKRRQREALEAARKSQKEQDA